MRNVVLMNLLAVRLLCLALPFQDIWGLLVDGLQTEVASFSLNFLAKYDTRFVPSLFIRPTRFVRMAVRMLQPY
jgi:hypothetical protein